MSLPVMPTNNVCTIMHWTLYIRCSVTFLIALVSYHFVGTILSILHHESQPVLCSRDVHCISFDEAKGRTYRFRGYKLLFLQPLRLVHSWVNACGPSLCCSMYLHDPSMLVLQDHVEGLVLQCNLKGCLHNFPCLFANNFYWCLQQNQILRTKNVY